MFWINKLWKMFVLVLYVHLVSYTTPATADAITYLEAYTNNINGVNGLNGISDVAVSLDGKFVYTASYAASAVSIFERDLITGQLTYVSTKTGLSAAFSVDVSSDNKSLFVASPTGSVVIAFSRDLTTGEITETGRIGGSPTGGFVSVSSSPDAKHVYGIGGSPSGLVVYSHDQTNSSIARLADYADDVGGNALGQVFSPTGSPIKNIASSTDGRFVYVTSTSDNAVSLFNRDSSTGALTLISVYTDNVASVDGLQAASSTKLSPDGKHLYVTGQGESSVAIFSVNQTSGALTYLAKVTNGANDITDMQGARSLAISPDGKYVLVSAISSNSLTAFLRDSNTGLLTFDSKVMNAVNGVTNFAAPSGMSTDPLNRHLYVAAQNSTSLVVFALPTPAVTLSATTKSTTVSGPAIVLDNQLTVLDSDSPNLVSATVTISAGFINTDTLAVQTVSGINAVYDAISGVLSLTGTASLADYQTVLRSLTYSAGADASLGNGDTSQRTIGIKVSDGDNFSAISTITVTVEKSALNTVTFIDWDNTVLQVQQVAAGAAATAPSSPIRSGYIFDGWSTSFDNVTTALTVQATYRLNSYSVTVTVNGDGAVNPSSQTIDHGSNANFTVNLNNKHPKVTSNCNAVLNGNTLTTAAITASCQISLKLFDKVVVAAQNSSSAVVNESRTLVLSAGAGDKTLQQASVIRAGQRSVLDQQNSNAVLVKQTDGSYKFSASRTGRYQFDFTDAGSGEEVSVNFEVKPYIAFTSSKQPGQVGLETTLSIFLSDEAIDYPVTVKFQSAGLPTDLTELTISQTDNRRKDYRLTPVQADKVQLTLLRDDLQNAVLGTPASHEVVLQATKVALALFVDIQQNNVATNVVKNVDGPVRLIASQRDNQQTTYSFENSQLGLSANGAVAEFNPLTVVAGAYDVLVKATDANGRTGQYTAKLRIIESCPIGDCSSIGNSGIPASVNTQNSFKERLPLCPQQTENNRVSSCAADPISFIEAPAGYQLSLGAVSGQQSWSSGQFGGALNADSVLDAGYNQIGFKVNFDISDLDNPGEAVPVMIPLPKGMIIPENAVWRKFIKQKWQNFVVDAANKIDSAKRDSSGLCPSVAADTWQTGLVAGNDCVRLTIVDGGANDDDGLADSVVSDPGVLATIQSFKLSFDTAGAQDIAPQTIVFGQAIIVPTIPTKAGYTFDGWSPELPATMPAQDVKVTAKWRISSYQGETKGGSLGWLGLAGLALLAMRRQSRWALALLPLSLNAQATDWYGSVELGHANTSVDTAKLQSQLADAGITAKTAVEQQSRAGYRLALGYQLNQWLAVEAGWVSLGKIYSRFDDVSANGSPASLYDAMPQSGDGAELSLVTGWDLNNGWRPSFRLGAWRNQSDYRLQSPESALYDQQSSTLLVVGAGLGYQMSERWMVKLQISQYNTDHYRTRIWSAGAEFRF